MAHILIIYLLQLHSYKTHPLFEQSNFEFIRTKKKVQGIQKLCIC